MDAKQVLALIKEKDVKFVDFRFTDPRGKWQHTARMASATDEGTFEDGVMFDGSSIAGWKAINESDMVLIPDAKSAVIDPFAAQSSLILFCDIYEPSTGQSYSRDPRSTAKKVEPRFCPEGASQVSPGQRRRELCERRRRPGKMRFHRLNSIPVECISPERAKLAKGIVPPLQGS